MNRFLGFLGCGLAAMIVACYRPEVGECLYACATGNHCPDGLTCNADQMCALSPTSSCAAATDGAPDSPPCAWQTSNVDACELGAHLAMVDLITDQAMIEIDTSASPPTSTLPLPSGVRLEHHPQRSGGDAVVLIARDVRFTGSFVRVRGPLPLIILANETAVLASSTLPPVISIDPTGAGLADGCQGGGGPGVAPPAGSGQPGGGGGGGGMGTDGGPGGAAASGGTPGDAGMATASEALVPLQGGCRGGDGGGGAPAGVGGGGGGAIQISARTALEVNGSIDAGGGGGGRGSAPGGGGGGGAGGAILLEAETIVLGMAARVCANGGGGGSGGGALDQAPGREALCALSPAAGGGSGAGEGGRGGERNFAPQPGKQGEGPIGSGGGGGAVGRIRFNGAVLMQGAVVTPAPSGQP